MSPISEQPKLSESLIESTTTSPPKARPTSSSWVGKGVIGLIGLVFVGWFGVRLQHSLEKKKQIAAQQQTQAAAATSVQAPVNVEIKLITGQAESWLPTVELEGTFAAAQEADLGFKVPGQLNRLNVALGDTVKKGQLLAALDSSELSAQSRSARSQIHAAQAQVSMAKDTEKRSEFLVKAGAVGEASDLQAREQAKLAQAQLESAKAQLGMTSASIRNHRLLAPFAGTITRAPSAAGGIVGAGMALFHLQNLNVLKFKTTLSERDVALFHPGDVIEFQVGKRKALAKVTTILHSVDSATRRVPLEAVIENKEEPVLLAGSFVRGTLKAANKITVMKIPSRALRPGSQDEILVVKDGKIQVRRVTFTSSSDGSMLIRYGLEPNEQVIASPSSDAKSGDSVKVAPGASP
jgi:RND family efflux transporter MFP subunit